METMSDVLKNSDTGYMVDILSKSHFPQEHEGPFLPKTLGDFFAPYFKKHGSQTKVISQIDIKGSQGNAILRGKSQTTLEIYVQIALALELDIKKTQHMLAIAQQGGLHPRIRKDAAAIFAINHGYSVQEYKDFLRELGKKPPPTQDQLEAMDIPDTNEMWQLLEKDTFPDAPYLLEDIHTFLVNLLEERGITREQLKNGSGIEERYFNAIFNGITRASRDYYIRIALAAAGIDLRTTQRMLAVAKWGTLHPRARRDAAIIFAIEHNYNFVDTCLFLQAEKLDSLNIREKVWDEAANSAEDLQ